VLSADKNESRATLSGSRLSFMRSAYIVAVWKQDSHMVQHIGFTVLVGTIYLLLNLLNILPILLMFQILAFLNLQFLLGVTFL
jgi:hypothetical protein